MDMNKALIFLAAVAAALTMASCTIESQVYNAEYEILPSDWQLNSGDAISTYLYVTCPNKDITPRVFDNGTVNAFIWINSEGTWTPLTYVLPFEYTNPSNPRDIRTITEAISFEWREGEVTFIIRDMDGAQPYTPVEKMVFRVSVIK